MNYNAPFQWQCHPELESYLEAIVGKACEQNKALYAFSEALENETSSRLFDWIDFLSCPDLPSGFEEIAPGLFRHLSAHFPLVTLSPKQEIGIAVDSISDFLLIHGGGKKIEGPLFSPLRRALIAEEGGVSFWAVERRSYTRREPVPLLQAAELWATRSRHCQGLEEAIEVARQMVSLVGHDVAASLVLEQERLYWQARNRAGQLQKNRQDRLGLGWANHDHHTFRSSRKNFSHLVTLFETLGFLPRERYWAGQEAGWGAQVMEHPGTRLVLFLDVDLLPDELSLDFSRDPLPPETSLGTVGLWCALHGDSILQAGMHHLEAQFLFDTLTSDLARSGIAMMEPFSNFPFLRQAFTKGEMWSVAPDRLDKLAKAGLITAEQNTRFLTHGALGSHLENLQRREGYKGFNQKNVSAIIQRTDPRSG